MHGREDSHLASAAAIYFRCSGALSPPLPLAVLPASSNPASPNRRAQEREQAAAHAAAEAKRAEAERKAIVDAQKVVAVWNARGRALWFYPTIGAAIAAGAPWPVYSCPACGQCGSVDQSRIS
jgi:hypothetical protein